jgi:hypothetical protein
MGLSEVLKARKQKKEEFVKEKVQNFITLLNVYIQASSAATLGIMNLQQLPQLKVMKQKFKIPTEGRLGIAEKKFVASKMKEEYKLSDAFFSEIDNSIKRCCKKVMDLQPYGVWFQSLMQDVMMAVSLDVQVGLRLPLVFRKWMKSMIQESVHKIVTSADFKNPDLIKSAINVRTYKEKLHFSEDWLTDVCFVYIILARGSKMK